MKHYYVLMRKLSSLAGMGYRGRCDGKTCGGRIDRGEEETSTRDRSEHLAVHCLSIIILPGVLDVLLARYA